VLATARYPEMFSQLHRYDEWPIEKIEAPRYPGLPEAYTAIRLYKKYRLQSGDRVEEIIDRRLPPVLLKPERP
jgi:hypothetical protein